MFLRPPPIKYLRNGYWNRSPSYRTITVLIKWKKKKDTTKSNGNIIEIETNLIALAHRYMSAHISGLEQVLQLKVTGLN